MRAARVGPVSKPARAAYRARLADSGDDASWRRPETKTADEICTLLGIDPVTLTAPRDRGSEGERTAGQALVVALDSVVDAGYRGGVLTFNLIVDALAGRWSLAYRDAQQRGATVSYDMSEATLKSAWRDLLDAGVNVPALWTALVVKPLPQLGKLYHCPRISGRGSWRGRRVELVEGGLFDDVLRVIQGDRQYRRPERLRVLLADDDNVRALPVRQDVCAEVGYNVVNLNRRSRDVLGILESSRLQFHVDRFRVDYEAAKDGNDADFVNQFRSVYEQTAGFADYSRAIEIRSRFFRAVNRRFHAADFWPDNIPAKFREQWFTGAAVHVPLPDDPPSARALRDSLQNNRLIERDISSSQTQLLAAFLGLDDLEKLAASRDPKFKVYLAQHLWALHESEGSTILANGYRGPDERLVAFIKEHWMRWNYGGKVSQIVLDLARDRETYGPGWNCDVFKAGDGSRPAGVTVAADFFTRFVGSLPEWSKTVTKFLDACQYIGRNADIYRGVAFTDPLDGAEIRWNPVQRATKKVVVGKRRVEARLPGRLMGPKNKRRFVPLPPKAGQHRVDLEDLASMVAPCLVHTLDAYFNALLLEHLKTAGIRGVVAVHDGWFVPAFLLRGDDIEYGETILSRAIADVGPEWLSGVDYPVFPLKVHPPRLPDQTRPGLGVVYDFFVKALSGSTYEAFGLDARSRWLRRVYEQRWPRFIAT